MVYQGGAVCYTVPKSQSLKALSGHERDCRIVPEYLAGKTHFLSRSLYHRLNSEYGVPCATRA
jgi:hypothetical protein